MPLIRAFSFFLFTASLNFAGCSVLEPHDQSPSSGNLSGVLVETHLSGEELRARQFEVKYRFRSVPLALVEACSNCTWSGVSEIKAAPGMMRLFQERNSQNLSNSLSAPTLSLVQGISSREHSYNEAGFSAVFQRLQARNMKLNPVRVAIIDTGVVAASSALRTALVKSTNFSVLTNECAWDSHGTSIASVLVGVFSGGQSACRSGGGYEAFQGPAYAPNVKIHSLKISFEKEGNTLANANYQGLAVAVALDEAVAEGAEIVNLSFAYDTTTPNPEASLAERYVMANAAAKGVIFVAAAGNQGKVIDSTYYPATYDVDNLVVVGAHTANLRHFSVSNFGNEVDLTAQGEGVLGSTVSGEAQYFSGTSQAVPVVVAALALHKGLDSSSDYRWRLRQLFSSANSTYAAEDAPTNAPISRYGRLDVAAFLKGVLR